MTKTIDRSDTAIPPGLLIIEKVPPRILVRGIKNDLTRRRFLIGAGSLLLLPVAGCGSEEGAGDEPEAARTRRFTDEVGTVEIPANPRRIVTVDDRTLEAALGVGAPVVGAVGRYQEQLVPPAFENLAEGVGEQANLEAIAALDPDLIVGQRFAVEGIEDDLRRLAPVVLLDHWQDDTYIETKWEEHFRRVAYAAGREERAVEELASLDEAFVSFREDFPGDPAEVELSITQIQPEQWLFFTGISFCGEIVDRLGFSRPEVQRRDDTDRVYLSYERLSLADGDAVMLTVDALEEGVGDRVDEVTSGALWQRLDAGRRRRGPPGGRLPVAHRRQRARRSRHHRRPQRSLHRMSV